MMQRFPSGIWAVVLIVSVLVNGLVLGVVGAGAMAGLRVGQDGPSGPASPPLSIRMLADGLPPEARAGVRDRLREDARAAWPLMADFEEANREAMRAMAAEDFDAEAALAAFEDVRQARSALERSAHEMVVTLFADLPPETRAELIERNERRGRWGRFDGPGDRDGPPGFRRDWGPRRGPDGPPPPDDGPSSDGDRP